MKRWLGICAVLAWGCNELPSPPATVSRAGLYQDTLGRWHDTITHQPFMDMPEPFRKFWQYCGACHSSYQKTTPFLEAPKAQRSMRLNNWDEVLAYGPERLLLAARSGSMPPAIAPPLPDHILGRAQAYLAAGWDTRGVPPAPPQPVTTSGIVDTYLSPVYLLDSLFNPVLDSAGNPIILSIDTLAFLYKPAQRLMNKYCADCHTIGGRDFYQNLAWTNTLQLDTLRLWQGSVAWDIAGRMDPSVTLDLMPPFYGPHQPTREERDTLLQWLNLQAPNSSNGQ